MNLKQHIQGGAHVSTQNLVFRDTQETEDDCKHDYNDLEFEPEDCEDEFE